MTKDIKIKYNSLLINEIQATYSRIQDFLFWCPGGIGVPGHSGGWYGSKPAEPNCMNGAFIAAFYGKEPLPWEEDIILPTIAGGYFTVYDYFHVTAALIDGDEISGLLIAANNKTIYLQRTHGSSDWDAVATVPDEMEPSFIKVSPNGNQVALGCGCDQPLVIIETSILSKSIPPQLFSVAVGVKIFPAITYYDGDWYNEQYFIVDGGNWPNEEPPYDPESTDYYSGVGIVDTDYAGDKSTYYGVALIYPKSGASAGIRIDSAGNLFCGCGFGFETGQVRGLSGNLYNPASPPGTPIDYSSLKIILEGKEEGLIKLSAASLNIDFENNLFVGGGNYFDTGGGVDYGYAALIKKAAVDRAFNDDIPVDVSTSDWREFQPDSCGNDSATYIVPGSFDHTLAVCYNRNTEEPECALVDEWHYTAVPLLKIYYEYNKEIS